MLSNDKRLKYEGVYQIILEDREGCVNHHLICPGIYMGFNPSKGHVVLVRASQIRVYVDKEARLEERENLQGKSVSTLIINSDPEKEIFLEKEEKDFADKILSGAGL